MYQIAAMLVMTLMRTLLRRLTHDPSANQPDFKSHVLDWQALEKYRNISPEQRSDERFDKTKGVPDWRLCYKSVGTPA